MPQDNLSWIKKAKSAPSKKEHRLIVENPEKVQSFLDSTHTHGGASMFLNNMNMVQGGQKMYLVGQEPSRKTKEPVKTAFVDQGSLNPRLSAQQFANHFLRLKEHATTKTGTTAKKSMIGSWVNSKSPKTTKEGVQIDLSSGYKSRRTAEKKMINRDEDAISDASKYFENIYNEDVRHKYTDTPRPKKKN